MPKVTKASQNRSAEYWLQEANRLDLKVDRDALKLDKLYRAKMKVVQSQLERFYSEYATKNGLGMDEAKALLTPKEFREFNKKLRYYIKSGRYSDDVAFMASMERMTGVSKIDRYQRLQVELKANISDLKKAQKSVSEQSLEENYSETEKAVKNQFQTNFKQTSQSKIRAVINSEFQGRRFSSRVWTQRSNLSDKLFKTLTNNFLEGNNWNALKSDLKRSFGATDYEARRLLITETARINSIAKQSSFSEAGFDKYQYIAVGDERTSQICKDHDDNVYLLKDLQVGVNAPPLHVYCRSTTVPYEDIGEEIIPPKPKPKPKKKPLKDMNKTEVEKEISDLQKEEDKRRDIYRKNIDGKYDELEVVKTDYRKVRGKTVIGSDEYTKNKDAYYKKKKAIEAEIEVLNDLDTLDSRKYYEKFAPLDKRYKEFSKLTPEQQKKKDDDFIANIKAVAEKKRLAKIKEARSLNAEEVISWETNSFTKHTPDYIKALNDKYDGSYAGILHNPKSGAYYDNYGAINMGKRKFTNEKGIAIYRHEKGHFLDDHLGRDGIGGEQISRTLFYSGRKDFTDAMALDRKTIMTNSGKGRSSKAQKAIKEALNKKHNHIQDLNVASNHAEMAKIENELYKSLGIKEKDFKKWYADNMGVTEAYGRDYERKLHLLQAMDDGDAMNFFRFSTFSDYNEYTQYAELMANSKFMRSVKSKYSTGALSDIIGSATMNNIAGVGGNYGIAGHTTSYLRERGMPQTEIFANITQLLGFDDTGINGKLLEAFIPVMTKQYITDIKRATK